MPSTNAEPREEQWKRLSVCKRNIFDESCLRTRMSNRRPLQLLDLPPEVLLRVFVWIDRQHEESNDDAQYPMTVKFERKCKKSPEGRKTFVLNDADADSRLPETLVRSAIGACLFVNKEVHAYAQPYLWEVSSLETLLSGLTDTSQCVDIETWSNCGIRDSLDLLTANSTLR